MINEDADVHAFQEFLKSTITNNFTKKKLAFTNLFVFDCATDNRKIIFDTVLAESTWIAKQTNSEQSQTAFDYVYVKPQNFTPKQLFDFLKENKNKVIIFNDNAILKSQELVSLLEGAVCRNPGTDLQWNVSLDSDQKFLFSGNIIFLTDMTMYKFKRIKKYFYICRDVKKV